MFPYRVVSFAVPSFDGFRIKPWGTAAAVVGDPGRPPMFTITFLWNSCPSVRAKVYCVSPPFS